MWIDIKFNFPTMKSMNDRLIESVLEALELSGYEAAKEVCRNTKGKTAATLYRFIDEGVLKYD